MCALQVEVGEMPLYLRRKQLSANYWVNLRGHRDVHPTKQVLQTCWEREGNEKLSFGWTGDATARDLGVYGREFCPTVWWPKTPVWVLEPVDVDLHLMKVKERNKNVDLVHEVYTYIERKYKEYVQVFTDGSKDPMTDSTGSAVAVPSHRVGVCRRTSDFLSVYTVELYAIRMALEWVEQVKPNAVLICSDSASALVSLRIGRSSNHQDLLSEVMEVHSRVIRQATVVTFIWVPAHMGIMGNERVDKLAKQAVKKGNIDITIKLSKAEGKGIVWKEINKEWQQSWDQEIRGRHLYSIQRRVGSEMSRGGSRREEVVMTRLRIGHSNLNETLHIIGKHPTGLCEFCQAPETVEHVLVKCRKYSVERKEMMEGMERAGLTGAGLKDILECAGSGQGRKCLFRFLNTTSLMGKM